MARGARPVLKRHGPHLRVVEVRRVRAADDGARFDGGGRQQPELQAHERTKEGGRGLLQV